jgi:hypothetical protein
MIDPNDPSYKPRDYRKVGLGLCLAAIVLFVYSAFSYRWLENTNYRDARIGFSLIAFEACQHDKCQTTSSFSLVRELEQRLKHDRHAEKPSTMFAPSGVITMGLALLSVIALGASVFFAWKQKRLAWKILPTTIALLAIMGALIFGCLFIAKKPGGYGAVGVGPSFWAFAIACVVGIAGGQMLNKLIKPLDPDLNAHLPPPAA